MEFRADKVDGSVARLEAVVGELLPRSSPVVRPALERWRIDAAALLFHLRRSAKALPLLAVVGGTGTGKSTLVNRLLGQAVSATSFRRTFTSGAVAIASRAQSVPDEWLGVEHVPVATTDLPARGRSGALLLVEMTTDLTTRLTLVDTPDLDGDQPAHHLEADRVFRWADAVLFLVTPEKYQMTELLPYYRLARRYALPAVFVMNKSEQHAVVEDYARLLHAQAIAAEPSGQEMRSPPVSNPPASESGSVFVVPRDDAGYEPPPEQNLTALREALGSSRPLDPAARAAGLRNRTDDLLGRAGDQVLAPLRHERMEIDRLITLLRGMERPVPGVDVNPITQQLQRRMQQRSVLYLMGPQRVLDRVRQVPGLMVRLPRVTWDYVMRGNISPAALSPQDPSKPQEVPDFAAILKDQFAVLQSRLDETLRSSDAVRRWVPEGGPPPYQQAMVDPADAGQIAAEELAALNTWLEQRWNATPRDTRMIESLLKYLPGRARITRWTETAPYLLVLVVAAATHHLFGQIDLVVLGGWGLATWLSERLSNEVAAQTRRTNQKISDRFARLAHEQIERMCRWLDAQAPTNKGLERLERALDEARDQLVS